MEGHYEAPYVKQDAGAVRAGEWAGPPLTFKLPQGGGYASITEADLVTYSGMAPSRTVAAVGCSASAIVNR
jgi:alpha-glucosidase